MTDQEIEEIQTDLQEMKRILKIISKQVAADSEVAAVQSMRVREEERVKKEIHNLVHL